MLIDAGISLQNEPFSLAKNWQLLSFTKLPNPPIHQFLAVDHKKRIMLSYLVGKILNRGWDTINVSNSKNEAARIAGL